METQVGLNAVLQKKVDDFIERSKVDSEKIYRQLENREIEDFVVPSANIDFGIQTKINGEGEGNGSYVALRAKLQNESRIWKVNGHSANQIGAKLGLPAAWVEDSINGQRYEQEAVAFALNKYMSNYEGKDNRFLMRNVDNTVRGFLSTSYKRMNTREIFMKFIETAKEFNLPLIGAFEGDARDYLEILDPKIIWIETPNNGWVAYARGAQLKNGDFGGTRLEFRSFWKKAICLNGAIGQSYIKEVHLGSRLAQDFVYSIETINKETEVKALKVRDAVRYVFSERNQQFEEAQIVEASGKKIDLVREVERLPKLGMTKTETKAVESVLMARNENDGLFGEATIYLLANAISAYANTLNPQRSLIVTGKQIGRASCRERVYVLV